MTTLDLRPSPIAGQWYEGNPRSLARSVDDFLANGRTAAALIDMAREAGAEVLGAGFVVEKRFKHGREYLESLHVAVSSLAQVEHLENGRAILTHPRKD